MSDQLRLELLFAKYLQRACTPQEVEEMIDLLNQAGNSDALDAPMHALWEKLKTDTTAHNADWEKMYSSITRQEEEPAAITRKLWWRYAAAAILIPLLGTGIYWYSNHSPSKASQPAITRSTTTPVKNQVAARQTIHLPDGSTVVLNEGSKLNYPSAFNGKSRNVYLTGEGFFDIQHNPKQPFFVHTGKISIKVLGTAFNVKTLAHFQEVEVTVTRGKVEVLNEDKNIGIIGASQQLSFVAGTGVVKQSTVDTIPVIAWKPAEIFFNDITMEEVAGRLQKRFDLTIEFANPAIKNCRVSATFSEDDLPEEILSVVCAVSKSEYRMADKKIIINGKGCN